MLLSWLRKTVRDTILAGVADALETLGVDPSAPDHNALAAKTLAAKLTAPALPAPSAAEVLDDVSATANGETLPRSRGRRVKTVEANGTPEPATSL